MNCRLNRIIRAAALAGLLAAAGAFAEQPAVTLLGSGFTGTPFHITGNLVAESDSLYETIRDYSDPAAPVVVGWLDHSMDSYLNDAVYDAGLLVGMTRADGLGTIGFVMTDVSNPAAPVEYGTIAGMGFDSGWLRGRAFSGSSQNIMVTYDLSVPTAPAFMAFNPLGAHAGSRWPVAIGNTLFLIDHDNTLRAFDVSDALHPALLATPAIAGDRIDALAAGQGVLYALVTTAVGLEAERLELVTCDVGNPAAPGETDRQLVDSGAGALGRALIASEDLLVAATADGRVCSFGLASAAHPVAGWTLSHDCTRLVVTPSVILIREGRDLLNYKRTPYDEVPAAPVRFAHLPVLSTVAGQGPLQLATYTFHSDWLSTVDVSDPYRPRLNPPKTFGWGGLQYVDGLGAMGNGSGSRLVDFSDPANPVSLGYASAPEGHLRSHLVSRSLLAFESTLPGLTAYLFDISNPAQPVAAGWFPDRLVLDAAGHLAAGATGSQVNLYDLSDLGSPHQLGTLPNPGTVQFGRFWRGYMHAVSTRNGDQRSLESWDVSNPAAPILVASLPLTFLPSRLDLHGNRLYAQSTTDVQVFDLGNTAQPVSLGAFRHSAALPGFAVNGNVTTISGHLVTFRNDGLSAASAPQHVASASARLAPAWPNPFNPSTSLSFVIDSERDVALSVYDVRGRLLAELARGRFAAGEHHVTWDGTDAGGSVVAAGVYLVRMHGPGVEAVQAVTLLK